jgi:glucose-1-phosphate thymidylyltransferase
VDIILPVAGLGTRLRPQTWSKPKPLVGLAGKPMLAHVLDRVMPLRPGTLVFITGFLGEQIEEWARANYDMPLAFVEQPEMRGQTDAIIRVRELVQGDAMTLFPDMVFEADFSVLDGTDADVVIFTKEVDDPSAFGVAVVEGGRVVRLVEKPQEPISREALAGIYYFRRMPDLYDAIEEQMRRGIMLKNEYFLADAVQIMVDRGAKVITAPITVWEDCGNAEALLSTNRYLLDRAPPAPTGREGAVIVPPSAVADSATLERAVVGPHASVGEGVTIRDAVVRDAIVEDGATVEAAVVEHSLVGRKASVRGRAVRLNVGDTSTVEL